MTIGRAVGGGIFRLMQRTATRSIRTRRRAERRDQAKATRQANTPSRKPAASARMDEQRTANAQGRPVAGPVRIDYSPQPDGRPDPGEVVWGWVSYEEDASRGKDRPILVIGRRGRALVGLMLTSKDHDLDERQEAREGRHWMDVGSGEWDSSHRPSEARLDRLIVVDPVSVRREGAVLDRATFERVVMAARPFIGARSANPRSGAGHRDA